jgi:DNA invertase Pin-like site-specific DNA recombinase
MDQRDSCGPRSTHEPRPSTSATRSRLRKIAEYAAENGLKLVRSYEDFGKSGLTLKRRAGLQDLLKDVIGRTADFDVILVLDVSRWGRFQDPDQAAHYEFICREAGIKVHYCKEMFPNDGSLIASLLKHMKRIMAGEYSQELSRKVQRAQCHQAAMGFKQGGSAPYGFRRGLIDDKGRPAGLLEPGERKARSPFRVVYLPGPDRELQVLAWMFEQYADKGAKPRAIRDALNQANILNVRGAPWTTDRVRATLRHELVIGNYVFNKTTQQLRTPARNRPPDQWVRTKVLDPVIPADTYARACERRRQKTGLSLSRDEIVERLRQLLAEKGNLTGALVEACSYLPSVNTVKRTTAGMQEAFAEAGGVARTHEPRIDGMTHYPSAFLIERLSVLLAKHGRLSRAIIEGDRETPGSTVYQRRFGGLRTAYALAGYDRTLGGLCRDAQRAHWDPILAQRRAASVGGSGPDESAIVNRPQPDDEKELGR